MKENVYLEGFEIAEKFVRSIIVQQKIFKEDLWFGVSGDKVGTLQEYLIELGYYKGKIDKYYSTLVHDVFDLRQEGDYKDLVQITREDAAQSVAQAREFIAMIKTHISMADNTR